MKRFFSMSIVLLLLFSLCGQVFAAKAYSFTAADILADDLFCSYYGTDNPIVLLGEEVAFEQYASYLENMGVSAYVDDDTAVVSSPAVDDAAVDPGDAVTDSPAADSDVVSEPVVYRSALLSVDGSSSETETSGGLKSAVVSIFGEYQPPTYETVVVLSDGSAQVVQQIPDGAAGVDWEYVCGIILFAVLLYCILRLVGVVLR